MNIPIENIYYLLCYAWDKLDEKERVNVSAKDYTQLVDLFARILANGTKLLLKRGIDRSYVAVTEELSGIKGKLAISETLKRNILQKQRTICSYDDFSPNILVNQILVSTLSKLLFLKQLDKGIKDEIRSLMAMLPEIDVIPLSYSVFSHVRLNRNNRFYGLLLNVCEIIYQSTLPSEKAGEFTFMDFTRDENKMNQLFEAFVRNFYRLEQNKFTTVRRETIRWQFDDTSHRDNKYLPQMHTDITLENEQEKIIMDAKFYRQTMAVNFEKERVHSGNLYQVFSYLLNQEDGSLKTQNASGILLYPTIEKEYSVHYRYKEHNISIETVNLNADWKIIDRRLKEIVGFKP